MTPAKTLLAFLILSTAFVFAFPNVAISRGDVTDSHSGIARKCWSCHQPFRGAAIEKCISCHKIRDIGRVTTGGDPLSGRSAKPKVLFHAGLANKDCSACHAVHIGGKYTRTATKFRHDLLADSIKSDCLSCHNGQKPLDNLHRAANKQCHTCHGTGSWRPATFDHNAYFRFDSNHPSRCDTCHTDTASYASYTCYGCHAHTLANMTAAHAEEGIRNLEQCARCHRTGNAEGLEGRERD
jgi:hypothetical protein